MTTPQIRIIDGDTVTDRDMNSEELATYKAVQDDIKTQTNEKAEREAARQAVLTKLGLTVDEVAALLS
jgi:hypothetical protein